MNHGRKWALFFVLGYACVLCAGSWASGINTDTALTPNKGGTILRFRTVYSQADGRGRIRDVKTSRGILTISHGISEKLGLFVVVPYVHREVEVRNRRGTNDVTDSGLADLTVFVKYRFWQQDTAVLDTYRWAFIGGLNIRSGDSDFSSDSYDPLAGLVVSLQRGRHHVDGDMIYQLNTGSGAFRHDSLRYDLAYSYRAYPKRYEPGRAREVDVVAEINAEYTTDGSHEVFLSPGVQYHMKHWMVEGSVQIPVIQDLGARPETDYKIVLGFRYHW